jgi:UDP-glucose 4-epimerase
LRCRANAPEALPQSTRLIHVVKPRRTGDPTCLVADPSAALGILKFRAAHSDLATIIRTAWAWHRTAHPAKVSSPDC